MLRVLWLKTRSGKTSLPPQVPDASTGKNIELTLPIQRLVVSGLVRSKGLTRIHLVHGIQAMNRIHRLFEISPVGLEAVAPFLLWGLHLYVFTITLWLA